MLVSAPAPGCLRAVTHLDVSAAAAERAADTLRRTVRAMAPAGAGA